MSSVNTQEISQFQKDSAHWWDESGPFAPLHKMNPVRLSFIRDKITSHFGQNKNDLTPAKGLKVLDVGCGGGILCEPLSRMGAEVIGVDADSQAIEIAKEHANTYGLDIKYINGAIEDLSGKTHKYDVVTALEIVEHVDNPEEFIANCLKLLKPNGLFILSTLNRTAHSFAIGKVAAEYIVKAVPAGTHTWKKFLKPSEINDMVARKGLSIESIKGITYNVLNGEFKLNSKDLRVNYILSACK